ncbi:MAG: hypothetical protein QG578_1390, partial [Thermodesulfobacteriota bacterium]|nr:hypothetical protein [Thermodesulfobacteriota bacterium]
MKRFNIITLLKIFSVLPMIFLAACSAA